MKLTEEDRLHLRIARRKALIRNAGKTYADFGCPTVISLAIHEKRKTVKVRRRIARRLRVRYGDFWGDHTKIAA